MSRRLHRRLWLGLLAGALVFAACSDDDAGGSANTETTGAIERCAFVTVGDVEAAFGGSAEPAPLPEDSPPGTCVFAVEGSDAGGDGQIAVVPLEDADDVVGAFELNCEVEDAEEVPDVGDRACITTRFQELYILTGDRQLLVRATLDALFDDDDPAALRESFLELGRTAVASA